MKIFRFNELYIGVTIDLGPRILYATLVNDRYFNILGVVPNFTVKTPRVYGESMVVIGSRFRRKLCLGVIL